MSMSSGVASPRSTMRTASTARVSDRVNWQGNASGSAVRFWLTHVGDKKTVDDKAGWSATAARHWAWYTPRRVLARHGGLLHPEGHLAEGVERLVRRLGGADNLDELHLGNGCGLVVGLVWLGTVVLGAVVADAVVLEFTHG